MIINDLDGYYIVFDTKNWNTELDTLVNKTMMLLRNASLRRKRRMERFTKVMDKFLTDAKLRWEQVELLQKLHDAAERHKRVVILKGRREG